VPTNKQKTLSFQPSPIIWLVFSLLIQILMALVMRNYDLNRGVPDSLKKESADQQLVIWTTAGRWWLFDQQEKPYSSKN
jgi:hypothetical protein